MEEKRTRINGLIVLVVILFVACAGMGAFIFMNMNKLTAQENTEINEAKNNKEETSTEENVNTNNAAETDNKYIEKVYSSDSDSLIFFKSGNCVLKHASEYTAHCKYYVENNEIYITHRPLGANAGGEQNSTYIMVTDHNNEEYIEYSADSSQRYKCLKEYS